MVSISVRILLGLIVSYFSFGLLASTYLDYELAKDGIIQQARVIERWQTTAKSKQIIDKAKVQFFYNDKEYQITVDASDQITENISIVFAPTLPYYAEAGGSLPQEPTMQSAFLKSLFAIIFGTFSLIIMVRD